LNQLNSSLQTVVFLLPPFSIVSVSALTSHQQQHPSLQHKAEDWRPVDISYSREAWYYV